MPAAAKCPTCGHRILQTSVVRICSNCGAFLPDDGVITRPTDEERQIALPSARPQVVTRPPALTRKQSDQSDAVPYNEPGIIPYNELGVVPYEQDERQLAPLRHLPTPYDQQNALQTPLSAQEMAPVASPEWVDKKKLPRGFPRRPADISGTLIYVQSQLEKPANDILVMLIKGASDILWSSSTALTQQNKDKDQEMVTALRVHLEDGSNRDARIRGYLVSASLTIGDVISLWGTQRQGTLHVSRGYNHTSKSKISTRGSNVSFAILLTLAIFAVVVYLIAMNGGSHIPWLPF
ncbi:hypothetical protein ccbrp13_31080 [Ktedonobacteria bacterium brp13]|nr:hypothetical protein ccbrp13_31080 [Ktedonobacteria bacterium brp13]